MGSLSRIRRWAIDIQKNRQFLSSLLREKEHWVKGKDLSKRFSTFLLADIFLNAERRAEEGKFDDAVARLYRLTEMIAQARLAAHGIDTSDVDITKVPGNLHAELEGHRNPRNKRIELPLFKSYEILSELGEEIGRAFLHDNHLRHYLASRNNSVLAHGTDPVTQKDYTELHRDCGRLLLLDGVAPGWERIAPAGIFSSMEMAS